MPLIPRPVIYLTAALSGIAIGYSLPKDAQDLMPLTGTLLNMSPPAPDVTTAETELVIAPQEEVSGGPAWVLRTEPAAFDDLTNVYLSVPSDQPLRCGPRRRASLMLRCFEDRTAIYIAHDCSTPLMDPEGWDVDLRLDQAEVQSIDLPVDSHGEAFGHWTYREARTMMEELLEVQSLHVRFTDLTGTESQMSFPVAGLAEPLETLSQACHWSAVPPWEQVGPPQETPQGDLPVATGPDAAQSSPTEPQIAATSPEPEPQVAALDDVSLTSGSTPSFVLTPDENRPRQPTESLSEDLPTDQSVVPDEKDLPEGLTMGERRLLEHARDAARN